MTGRRRDDQIDFRFRRAGRQRETVVAERQRRGEAQFGAVAMPGALAAVLEPALPFDLTEAGRQAQVQNRIGRFLGQDMRGREPEWRRAFLLGELIGGLSGIGRQPERRDQRHQRCLAGLMRHPERIDMAGRDPEETGNMAQFVEPAHDGRRSRNAAQAGASSVPGIAAEL